MTHKNDVMDAILYTEQEIEDIK